MVLGLFGVRDKKVILVKVYLKRSSSNCVRAFELKLAQGARRCGHMEAKKVNEEIAKIRNVEPYKTIILPNRYEFIHNAEDLIRFVISLTIRSKTSRI